MYGKSSADGRFGSERSTAFTTTLEITPDRDDLPHLGPVDRVTQELERITAHKTSEREEEHRDGQQYDINGDQENTNDCRRDSDDMQNQTDRVSVPFKPVFDDRRRSVRRTDHDDVSRNLEHRTRRTV
jgi:hypothetical protein